MKHFVTLMSSALLVGAGAVSASAQSADPFLSTGSYTGAAEARCDDPTTPENECCDDPTTEENETCPAGFYFDPTTGALVSASLLGFTMALADSDTTSSSTTTTTGSTALSAQ